MNTWRKVGCCLIAVAAVGVAHSATLKVDQVKQRYPWNGLVDIDYTITMEEGESFTVDDNLEVSMIDHAVTPAVTNRAIRFLQAPLPTTAGRHRVTWNANGDGVTNYTDNAEIVVKLVHYSAAYMVIDVSEGSGAKIFPVDFYNGAPSEGFQDDVYKGDKIVLRRIHSGSYVAGSPENEAGRNDTKTNPKYWLKEPQRPVALTRPFYIGIYEITQTQYEKVTGKTPSQKTGPYRPVENVTWTDARSTFMGVLYEKCRSLDENGQYAVVVTGFDLPAEFQWEYACRAGTTKAFNGSDDFDNTSSEAQANELAKLGRYLDNQALGEGGYAEFHTKVGSYKPNAWGLYDMHGNVWEWCRDYYAEDVVSLGQDVDPEGPSSGGKNRVCRGGGQDCAVNACRSAFRLSYGSGDKYYGVGFRLSLTMP